MLLVALVSLLMVQPAMAKPNRQTVKFYVYLHCDGCVQKVMKNIAYEKGVKDIVCSLDSQTVVVTYDAAKTSVPQLQEAFEKIGKPASLTQPTEKSSPASTHIHTHTSTHDHPSTHTHNDAATHTHTPAAAPTHK